VNYEILANGAVRCYDDPGEPGYGVISRRISVAPDEAVLLSALAHGRIVAEIGTGLGCSTLAMAKTAAHVFTVDCDPWVHAHVWPQLPKNVTPLSELVEPFPLVDMFFIDGLHLSEAVRADIKIAQRILRGRGVIVFHDINIPHVADVIRDAFGNFETLLPNVGWVNVGV